MKKLSADTKFAHLGKPGAIFSKGFERRLQKIIQIVDLQDKVILDQGCGEGVWMHQFTRFTDPKNVHGFDIDPESIEKFEKYNSRFEKTEQILAQNLKISGAEKLPYEDNTFDIVFSNEVLEHVEDDVKSSAEVLRVLKPNGLFIIFTPNRGWPFETHGMFLNNKYYWGNIPLLPWMSKAVFRKFTPHVRNYSNGEIKKVLASASGQIQDASFKIEHHSHVFPAFDKLERKFGVFGKFTQKLFHTIEKTPLHFFGISHFIVVRKKD